MQLQKFLWTLALGVVSTVAAALAARLLDRGYRRVTHHDPPEVPKWARMIVGPATKPIARAVQP